MIMLDEQEKEDLIKLGTLLTTVAQDIKIKYLNNWDEVKYQYITELIDQAIDVGFELSTLEDTDECDDTDV